MGQSYVAIVKFKITNSLQLAILCHRNSLNVNISESQFRAIYVVPRLNAGKKIVCVNIGPFYSREDILNLENTSYSLHTQKVRN